MSYQSDNMAFNNAMDSLSHYGVKGMEWGKRNEETLRKYGLLGASAGRPLGPQSMTLEEGLRYLREHPHGIPSASKDRDSYIGRDNKDQGRYTIRTPDEVKEMDSKIRAGENTLIKQAFDKTYKKYKDALTKHIKDGFRSGGKSSSSFTYYQDIGEYRRK